MIILQSDYDLGGITKDTLKEVQAAIEQLGQADSAKLLVDTEPDPLVKAAGEATFLRSKKDIDVLTEVTKQMDLKRKEINQDMINDLVSQVKIAKLLHLLLKQKQELQKQKQKLL